MCRLLPPAGSSISCLNHQQNFIDIEGVRQSNYKSSHITTLMGNHQPPTNNNQRKIRFCLYNKTRLLARPVLLAPNLLKNLRKKISCSEAAAAGERRKRWTRKSKPGPEITQPGGVIGANAICQYFQPSF